MDKNRVKEVIIRFKNGPFIKSFSIIFVITLFGQINFYIIKINTPFLILIKNINRFNIYFNNVINQLIGKNGIIINVTRK